MKKALTILLVFVSMIGFAATVKLEPAGKKKLNTFFSNFSEIAMEGFQQDKLTDDTMLKFALSHLYRNKLKSLKKSKDGNSVIATPELVDTATEKYFGKKIRKHKETSYTIPCADGEVFSFSQLTSLEDLGKSMFKAEGVIYSTGSGGTPDVHGTPEAWKKAGETVDVSGKFTALIESEGERYILVEYTPTSSENTATTTDAKPETTSDSKDVPDKPTEAAAPQKTADK